jgi:hypothetical protein
MTWLSKPRTTGLLLISLVVLCIGGFADNTSQVTAATVLDRYVRVTGGANLWHAQKSETDDIEGRALDDDRIVLRATITTTRSGDSVSAVHVPQEATEGVFKGTAWAVSRFSGVRIKHGAERDEAIRDSRMLEEGDWRSIYPHAQFAGIENLNGQLRYKIQLSSQTAEWFDADGGLLVRRETSELSPAGPVAVGFTVERWTEHAGLKQPSSLLAWRGDFHYRLTLNTAYNNTSRLWLPVAVSEYLVAERAGTALPNAEEIIERHIYESGGLDAFENLKTQRITGTLTFLSSNTEAHVDSFASDGGRYYQAVDVPGLGLQEEGSDGAVSWERSPVLGPRIKLQADHNGLGVTLDAAQVVGWRQSIAEVRTEAREQMDGHDCYRVRLMPRGNSPALMRWYDRRSGLLYRTSIALATNMGALPTLMTFEEYRDVAGFKWPTRVRMVVSGQNLLFSVGDIRLNEPIESAVFDLPVEVKQIAEKKAGDLL